MANGPNYEKHNITSAQLLLLPQADPTAQNGSSVKHVLPTLEHTHTLPDTTMLGKRSLSAAFYPTAKKAKLEAAVDVVPPPISGVGVMDVGQGNCNLLIGQPGDGAGADVWAYYDVGYPLWFYVSSLPLTMRFGALQYAGPIRNNQDGTMQVILSHWDWDHWRLGAVAQLNNLQWFVPNQPIGPAAANFLNTLTNRNVINAGTPPQPRPGNRMIYCCFPTANPPPLGMIINNTGLGMTVATLLPAADAAPHLIVLTGDANFDSVFARNGGYPVGITGIVAVHHGSFANDASDNLPPSAAPYGATGRIAYSYGITARGNHAYGFPVAGAVTNYQNGGWNNESSTAEGPNINNNGQGGRGNVQMGTQVALLDDYNDTAFGNFPNQLN